MRNLHETFDVWAATIFWDHWCLQTRTIVIKLNKYWLFVLLCNVYTWSICYSVKKRFHSSSLSVCSGNLDVPYFCKVVCEVIWDFIMSVLGQSQSDLQSFLSTWLILWNHFKRESHYPLTSTPSCMPLSAPQKSDACAKRMSVFLTDYMKIAPHWKSIPLYSSSEI